MDGRSRPGVGEGGHTRQTSGERANQKGVSFLSLFDICCVSVFCNHKVHSSKIMGLRKTQKSEIDY